MIKIIFLSFFIAIVIVLTLCLIFYGSYTLILNLKWSISSKWIIKNFVYKDNFISKLNKKLYEVILNLVIILKNINIKISMKAYKYVYKVAIILILIGTINEYKYKLKYLIDSKLNVLNKDIILILLKVIILIIIIITFKKSYKIRLRKNIKENYYKEVIDEYLNQKDLILDILKINLYNEEILYEILKYNNGKLNEISKKYKFGKSKNINQEILDKQYEKKIEDDIKKVNLYFSKLKKHKVKYEELDKFKIIFNGKSRYKVIYSINKNLCFSLNFFTLVSKKIQMIDTENIIKYFIENNYDLELTIEYKIRTSIEERIEFLRAINKVDKYIGLYISENNIDEILKRFKY